MPPSSSNKQQQQQHEGAMPMPMPMPIPCLPPGFRFHPTDEELIVHYLVNQAASLPCPAPIIAEVNIYTCNPWDLPGKALFGEKEWYFFSPRERKYPNGARPNRAAGEGYWKATGTDKAILSTPTSDSIAVKKALVFYRGKPPKGIKTDWIMHEYRLTPATKRRSASGSSSMRLDDWVLCRIHKKNNDFFYSDQEQDHTDGSTVDQEHEDSSLNIHQNYYSSQQAPPPAAAGHDDQLPLMSMSMSKSCSLTDLLNTIDFSTLSQMLLGGTPPDDDALPAEPPALLPPPSPLVINDASTPQNQTFYHNNNNNNVNMPQPQVVDARSDYTANNYSGLKSRKRIMTTDGATTSFDDGSNFTHVAKKLQLPNDSKISYCNQQLQYSCLMMSNPLFPLNYQQEQQQLLLNSHLQMQ